MDPSLAELSEMRTIDDTCAWIGMSQEIYNALFKKIAFKPPRLVRHAVAIKWSTGARVTEGLQVLEAAEVRELTPVEEGAG